MKTKRIFDQRVAILWSLAVGAGHWQCASSIVLPQQWHPGQWQSNSSDLFVDAQQQVQSLGPRQGLAPRLVSSDVRPTSSSKSNNTIRVHTISSAPRGITAPNGSDTIRNLSQSAKSSNASSIIPWGQKTSNSSAILEVPDATYARSSAGASVCPSGYTYITDVNTCITAGQSLGGHDCTSHMGGKHGPYGAIGCTMNFNNECIHFNLDNTDTSKPRAVDPFTAYVCQASSTNSSVVFAGVLARNVSNTGTVNQSVHISRSNVSRSKRLTRKTNEVKHMILNTSGQALIQRTAVRRHLRKIEDNMGMILGLPKVMWVILAVVISIASWVGCVGLVLYCAKNSKPEMIEKPPTDWEQLTANMIPNSFRSFGDQGQFRSFGDPNQPTPTFMGGIPPRHGDMVRPGMPDNASYDRDRPSYLKV